MEHPYTHIFPDAKVIQNCKPDGTSNMILLVGSDVLKIFRRRRSALREFVGEWAVRWIERKRGVSRKTRHATEKRSLKTWSRYGFDVMRTRDIPPPAGMDDPVIWMEYCPGRPLTRLMADPAVAWEEKMDHLRRVAREMSRRHSLAWKNDERFLVHERGSLKHVMIWDDRQVRFDFEAGYYPNCPMEEALAQEMAGMLRSLAQTTGDRFEEALPIFVESYDEPERLGRIADWALHHVGFIRILKRWSERWRRKGPRHVALFRRLKSAAEPYASGKSA